MHRTGPRIENFAQVTKDFCRTSNALYAINDRLHKCIYSMDGTEGPPKSKLIVTKHFMFL